MAAYLLGAATGCSGLVIGVLIVETWLAGRLNRARPARAEALTT